jgi:hypothetical protein
MVAGRVHKDIAPAMSSVGIIGMTAGIGFIVAGVIGYMLTRKLGLLPASSAAEAATD